MYTSYCEAYCRAHLLFMCILFRLMFYSYYITPIVRVYLLGIESKRERNQNKKRELPIRSTIDHDCRTIEFIRR